MKAYWWVGHANFGDALTPLLLERLLGQKAEWTPAKDAEFVMCGSVLTHLPRGWTGTVFGTGKARKADQVDLSKANVRALRGRLSGVAPTYGDPGLLVPLLVKNPIVPDIPLGVIPHWEDRLLARRHPGAEIIDVTADPMTVITAISRCRRIVSSSFHGIVVADAFGIPRRWERHPKVIPFKFADYGSIMGPIEPGVWGSADERRVQRVMGELFEALREAV